MENPVTLTTLRRFRLTRKTVGTQYCFWSIVSGLRCSRCLDFPHNSAVFETEIRIREGVGIFSVEGNQVGAINNYVGSRNSHFGSSVTANAVYTDVDVYNKNENGEWVKTKTEKRTFVTIQQ